MKNVIIITILLAMASLANAALNLAVNGESSEVTIAPGDTATIQVSGDGGTQPGQFFLGISSDSNGAAELDIENTTIIYVGTDGDIQWIDEEEIATFLGVKNPFIYLSLEDLPVPGEQKKPLIGLLVAGITLHCTGTGDVQLNLYDGDGNLIASLVIHQAITPALTALEIAGPNEVPENNAVRFNAIAHYEDGSTANVTNSAKWSIDNNQTAQIVSGGLLKTKELLTLDEEIVISASFQGKNVEVTAQKTVLVYADCTIAELFSRNIDGALEIKDEITQRLDEALERERRAKGLLREFANDPSFKAWGKQKMMSSGQNLNIAINRELLSKLLVQWSIAELENIDSNQNKKQLDINCDSTLKNGKD
jgi:hypothetical protein